jgi:hypothetical protein
MRAEPPDRELERLIERPRLLEEVARSGHHRERGCGTAGHAGLNIRQ